jgi:hypothetical protein
MEVALYPGRNPVHGQTENAFIADRAADVPAGVVKGLGTTMKRIRRTGRDPEEGTAGISTIRIGDIRSARNDHPLTSGDPYLSGYGTFMLVTTPSGRSRGRGTPPSPSEGEGRGDSPLLIRAFSWHHRQTFQRLLMAKEPHM